MESWFGAALVLNGTALGVKVGINVGVLLVDTGATVVGLNVGVLLVDTGTAIVGLNGVLVDTGATVVGINVGVLLVDTGIAVVGLNVGVLLVDTGIAIVGVLLDTDEVSLLQSSSTSFVGKAIIACWDVAFFQKTTLSQGKKAGSL